MNSEEGNTDYLSLKSLLQQWKLPHLLQHFMAQNISVDVLKMMKMQHIFELLHNFTCGDRIRFEFELEKWRLSIGRPLNNVRDIQTMPMKMPITMLSNTSNGSIVSKNYKTAIGRDCETQTLSPSKECYQPQNSSNNEDAFFNFQLQTPQQYSTTPPSLNEISPCTAQTASKAHTTIYSPRIRVNSPTLMKDHHARGRPCADIMAKQMSIVINAREILERCRPRGLDLMKIYETNNRFRPVERVELINLFAHYFYEQNIHLPVKLSYELERQILKLFPGERLKDYRTEKRGKIYIRLSNIKNNRRRAREAKAVTSKDQDKNLNDETFTMNTDFDPSEVYADDAETMGEENSNSSYDKSLKIYADDIKHETDIDLHD